MFGKITGDRLRQGFNSVKNHIVSGYHKTKNALNGIDAVVGLFKKGYSAIAPILDEVNPSGHIHRGIVKGLTAYDDVKGKIVNAHDKGEMTYNTVKKKIHGDIKRLAGRTLMN